MKWQSYPQPPVLDGLNYCYRQLRYERLFAVDDVEAGGQVL